MRKPKHLWVYVMVIALWMIGFVASRGGNAEGDTAQLQATVTPIATRPAVVIIPPTPTVPVTPTIVELRQAAQAIDIRELTRNTEDYIDQPVAYQGRVLQVMEHKAFLSDRVTYTIRFAVDGDTDNVLALRIADETGDGFRPLDDDMLSVMGIVEGRATFETVLGRQVVLPLIDVQHVETIGDSD